MAGPWERRDAKLRWCKCGPRAAGCVQRPTCQPWSVIGDNVASTRPALRQVCVAFGASRPSSPQLQRHCTPARIRHSQQRHPLPPPSASPAPGPRIRPARAAASITQPYAASVPLSHLRPAVWSTRHPASPRAHCNTHAVAAQVAAVRPALHCSRPSMLHNGHHRPRPWLPGRPARTACAPAALGPAHLAQRPAARERIHA